MSTLIRLLSIALVLAVAAPVAAAAADPEVRTDVKKKVIVVNRDGDDEELVFATPLPGDAVGLPPGLAWISEGGGFLGVTLLDLTPELRQYFGAPEKAGVMVSRVEEDSPAAKAGVKVGDIIIGVDKDEIESSLDLRRTIRGKKDGESARIEVLRDRRSQTLTATISERDRKQVDLGDVLLDVEPHGRGDALRRYFDAERLREMAENIDKQVNSPEFQRQLRRSTDDLEKRLEEMEKKLQEMEKRLKERSALNRPSDHT